MLHAPELIEQIRTRTDIVALVGRQVPLSRRGRNHMGRCPFHQERTPSFSVNADKGMFYCFGCHRGGDAFAFVMQALGMDFNAAVRHLAELAGVTLEAESPAQRAAMAKQQAMVRALGLVQQHCVAQLWGKHGAQARALLGERRVPAAQARAWGLGIATEMPALQSALTQAGHGLDLLTEAGVLTEARPDARWLIAGRLTIPIHDMMGQLVGFGARTLRPKHADTPKYINSRDSLLFHKRKQLFGLHRAHPAIRHTGRVALVEGYLDVLAAHRAGLDHAVAALGTALTQEHAQTCRKLAEEAVLLLDGDAAGERAAKVSTLTLLRAGLRVFIAWLPEGEDPASVVEREGPEALSALAGAAQGAIEALMERAFAAQDPSVERRVQAAETLMPLLDAMGESLERELYVGRLAERVGVPTATLLTHWKKSRRPAHKEDAPNASTRTPGARPHAPPRGRPEPAPSAPMPPEPEHLSQGPEAFGGDEPQAPAPPRPAVRPSRQGELLMVQELLLFPSLRSRYSELAEYLDDAGLAGLLTALTEEKEPASETLTRLVEAHVPDAAGRKRLLTVRPLSAESLDGDPTRANRTFDDILRRLKWRHVDEALKRVLRELRETERRGDATDLLLRRKQDLTARKRALSRASR